MTQVTGKLPATENHTLSGRKVLDLGLCLTMHVTQLLTIQCRVTSVP